MAWKERQFLQVHSLIHLLQAFGILHTVVQQLIRFQLTVYRTVILRLLNFLFSFA